MAKQNPNKKICSKCGKKKHISKFYNSTLSKDKHTKWCKQCIDAANNTKNRSEYYKNYHIKNKDKLIKKRYGVSLEYVNDILIKQDNKCAICFTTFDEKTKFCIDHNHTSGAVRGLLCHHCNLGYGHFKENIDILKNAIKYTELFTESTHQ